MTSQRGWNRRFDEPIPLPGGGKLFTLRQAIAWLAKEIPQSEHTMKEVQTAAHCVTEAAENGGPMKFARMEHDAGDQPAQVRGVETVDARTRELADAVIRFTHDVKQETGREWYAHPAANRALRFAVTARLARLKPEGDDMFKAGELPNNRIITSSEDPQAIGQTIEAFDFKTQNNQKAKAAADRMRLELLEKYPDQRKDHEHD
jgi:hypothetical protein